MPAKRTVYPDAGIPAGKYRALNDQDTYFERGAFQIVDTQYPAVAAPPFQSIKLPKGVIVSYVRSDGSILSTANT